MAERGFVTLAFDPSFSGESGGEPRNVASPDINTEDFMAGVDYLGLHASVDCERIGIIGICGWGGMALNAIAADWCERAGRQITQAKRRRAARLAGEAAKSAKGARPFRGAPC